MLQAIGHLKEALAHWRAAQDRFEEASTLYTIGLVYIEMGDRQKALEYTTQALAVARHLSTIRSQAGRSIPSARCITISGTRGKPLSITIRRCR